MELPEKRVGFGKGSPLYQTTRLRYIPGHGERTVPMGAVEGKAEVECELSLQGRVHPGQGQAV